jgi:alkanesulfonate monooxygenase SsuD/methylene tetrahydromethanopterin reductase-like flavin-dependent oxidoreductase (luciferase family)
VGRRTCDSRRSADISLSLWDGQLAVPSNADWLDPLIALSIAAAVTQTIRVATGVLLLPEHNPVLVAKQAASLDRLSGG